MEGEEGTGDEVGEEGGAGGGEEGREAENDGNFILSMLQGAERGIVKGYGGAVLHEVFQYAGLQLMGGNKQETHEQNTRV